MVTLRYVVVDVFTDRPLEGNQLAVFTDARGLDGETMQSLALEIGVSETIFILPPEQGGTVRVRIFTPRNELPFAGHPILGAAWVLAAPLQRGVVELEAQVGVIPVELERDDSGAISFGRMEQPVPTVSPHPHPAALCDALAISGSLTPAETYDNGLRHTFVVLRTPEEVGALRPDFAALEALDVQVSCIARSGVGWKTRMFAPSYGVSEDPATWLRRGPSRVPCVQARARRVGDVARDLAGPRDRAAADLVRARRGRRRLDRTRPVRRAGGRRRARRVQVLGAERNSATACVARSAAASGSRPAARAAR